MTLEQLKDVTNNNNLKAVTERKSDSLEVPPTFKC